MPHLWSSLVAALQAALTLVAALTGGNVGLAIVTVSIALRVALLPLTLRLARRAREQAARMEALKPELERLKKRFAKDPQRLGQETLALYRRHGIRPLDAGSLGALALQLPVVSALYSAIARGFGAGRRFLWIGDLAKPDALLVILTAALTYASSALGTSKDAQRAAALFAAALTAAIMWRVSAALGLYWASSTAVGAAQAWWLAREARRK